MRRFAMAAAAGTAALSAFALGGSLAHAQDAPAPPVADATSTVTLPLLGSPLKVDITTDAGGGLVDVALTSNTALTPTDVDPGKVRFTNDDGDVSVKVSTRHGGERVTAHAGSLGDISGPGQWSGDIFDSGDTTTVDFTIAAGADGGPDITGITVTSPVANTVGDVMRSSAGDDDDQGDEDGSFQWAAVRIEFNDSGQTRALTIKAVLATDGDQSHAALKIGLSKVRGALLAEGPAVGSHTWSGQLCDGTAASFTYDVADNGDISNVVATPTADVHVDGDHAKVAFSDHERVSIHVRGEGSEMAVGTREKIRCDRVDPTVNGAAVDLPDDNDDHDGDRDGDHDGDD
ncbi:MAG TPA: hypothetical protein VL916_10110, partial [Ilumatobacteraceae bacterium]|nr:hypothetical protein [Ilumatobacteraceae bacterium]